MFGWLSRLLGKGGHGEKATPRARPSGPAAAVPRAGPLPPAQPDAPPADAASPAEADSFAPFARALDVDAPGPGPEPEGLEPDPEEPILAQRVLEHFQKNRPGPASAPSLSLRLLGFVAQPNAEVGEMVRLISADAALAAGVLAAANSVFYRGREEIDTVRAAVVRLGLAEVARVAGAVSARTLFNPRLRSELAVHGSRYGALYHRSITVATAAASLALDRQGARSDHAYLGGMLFDVGKSIALRSMAAIAAEGFAPSRPELIHRVIEHVHVEVGGECHQEWNLPHYLTVIAVRHHDPAIPADPEFVELHAVRLCAALLDLREPWLAPRAAAEIVQSAGALGMNAAAVRSLDAELSTTASRVASTFGVASL